MRKMSVAFLVGAAALTSTASAHDFTLRFESQGECQRAWAGMNKYDRDFLRNLNPQMFETPGDVMKFLTEYVTCEYDPDQDDWYIADNRPRN